MSSLVLIQQKAYLIYIMEKKLTFLYIYQMILMKKVKIFKINNNNNNYNNKIFHNNNKIFHNNNKIFHNNIINNPFK